MMKIIHNQLIDLINTLFRYDGLYIRDGLNHSAPNMGPLTGYKGNSPTEELEGRGEGIFINFITNYNTRTRGFNISYEIIGEIIPNKM